VCEVMRAPVLLGDLHKVRKRVLLHRLRTDEAGDDGRPSALCKLARRSTARLPQRARGRTRLQAVPSAFQPDTVAETPKNIFSATCAE
jgi:hypothetical protein